VFQTLTGDVQGPLEVKGLVKIDGTLHGGAVVTGRLELTGTCHGDITVMLDGQADVSAVVHGDLHARGGKVVFRGILDGRLGVRDGDADVAFAVGSVLNGRRLEADGSFTEITEPGQFSIAQDAPLLRPAEENWQPVA
jgi:cytoskeletal protein CcmA (bactofilin family)